MFQQVYLCNLSLLFQIYQREGNGDEVIQAKRARRALANSMLLLCRKFAVLLACWLNSEITHDCGIQVFINLFIFLDLYLPKGLCQS